MPVHFRSTATDSMPERIKLTQDLELRYKRQQEEEQARNVQVGPTQNAAQGQQ